MRLVGIPIPELPPRRSSRDQVEDDSESSSADISTTESEGNMEDDDDDGSSDDGGSNVGEGHTGDEPEPAPMTKMEEPVLTKPVQEQVKNVPSPSVASGSEGGVPGGVDHAVVSPRLFPMLITFPNLIVLGLSLGFLNLVKKNPNLIMTSHMTQDQAPLCAHRLLKVTCPNILHYAFFNSPKNCFRNLHGWNFPCESIIICFEVCWFARLIHHPSYISIV